MKNGTIVGITGSYGSGLVIIKVKTGKKTKTLFGENGPVVRALNEIFPGFVEGHSFDPGVLIGKDIQFETDPLGILTQLAPAA